MRTELLVDADVHSISMIESAIRRLRKEGRAVNTIVFSAPGRQTNTKWQKFLGGPGVLFHPVPRRDSSLAEANDNAILHRLRQVEHSQSIKSIALLTSDFGFADAIAHIMKSGKDVFVFIPCQDRAVINRFRMKGVPVLELQPLSERFPKVKAFLRQDGSGYVQLTGAQRPDDNTDDDVQACESVMQDLGYVCKTQREYLSHGVAKFWLTNQLGSLTIYPPHCAVKQVCAVVSGRRRRRLIKCGGKMNRALVIPKPAVGRTTARQLQVYGSSEAKRIFKGGGPFMLPDSENIVSHVLTKLGYMDNRMNVDLAEAMLVFVNAPDNKYALRKQLDCLPAQEDKAVNVADKLRHAFLSHLTDGHWRLPLKDVTVRALLCKHGYLATPKAGASDVFEAMARYARKHHLPTMKTYNGYVFRILYSTDSNPDKTGAVEFRL